MNNTGWAVVIIILVVLLGGWWWYSVSQTPAPTDTAGTQLEGTQTPDSGLVGGDAGVGDASAPVEVRYGASGFVPASVSIPRGQAVRFVNDTAGRMWVAADEHPTHAQYDATDRATHCAEGYAGPAPFDQCEAGPSYTFIFTKPGTFEYHNHAAAQHGGTVVVQ